MTHKNNNPIYGIVVSDGKLNVRANPSKDAIVIQKINSGSEVQIFKEKSTDEYYAVCTAAGIEGFCVKDFIEVFD